MEPLTFVLIGIANLIVVSLFTLSGGIGLLMRPLMIFFGVPPQITIGTSRVSAIPGSIIAQKALHDAKKIDWKLVFLMAPVHVAGGLLGIYIITVLDDIMLKKVIGVLLVLAGLVFWLNKNSGLKSSKKRLGKMHLLVMWPLMFVLGSLLVIVGGTGPIARLLFIFGYGKTHIEAAAIQKAVNFWQTIITTGIFIALLLVDWILLAVLIVTSSLGNYVGTRLVLKKGEKYLRSLLLLVIFASAIKLIFFP